MNGENFLGGSLGRGREGGRICSEGNFSGGERRATVQRGSRGGSVRDFFTGRLRRFFTDVLLFFPCVLVFNDAHPVTGEWYWGYNVLGVLYACWYCRRLRR